MHRKPLFDFIRSMLQRPIRPIEVDALDGALDRALSCPAGNPAQDSVPGVPGWLDLGPEGIALTKQFEGCGKERADGLIEAYPDPGTGSEPWTIGWGATGPGIGPGTVWTQEQCDARLAADLARYAAEVRSALGDAPTSQSQFDAMVSFHYNTGAIARATLTRKHIAGDHAGAAREFDRWVRAGGRVMRGLVRRRLAEAALYRR